jgi:hypothetical protein
MKRICGAAAAALLLAAGAPAARAAEAPATSCVTCHGDPDLFDEAGVAIVHGFASDVHAAASLSCQDCHGGNPDPAVADDAAAAMDEDFAANPFRGAPERTAIPAFCGRCHSDPEYMRRFRPDARIDQEREYRTSQHGIALARGDKAVATCIDCHGVHGILAPSNPASPVYPTHVAETCRKCHADAERMAGRKLADGRPMPVDQFARWERSVHAKALLEKGDLSAPTCNDCHGNHGAAPPGLKSIAFVCGQCHGREADLFRASPKRAGFEAHNEFLADAGSERCAACHEGPDLPTDVTAFSECTSCHGNHAIVRPTVAMLAPLPDIPCAFCHQPEGPVSVAAAEPDKVRRHYETIRDDLLAEAASQGLSGQARFDWMVDQALALPFHTRPAASGAAPELRPEFANLFTKFRLGKSTFTYQDPVTGQETEGRIVRCSTCHQAAAGGDEGTANPTAAAFVRHIQELTSRTGQAERILLAARRGGVETRQALAELEQAVDAQIELEVLVHTFSTEKGGAFLAKSEEGLGHARQALEQARAGLDELGYRRRGLTWSLAFIALLLVGLALKIRQLS